jgi:hypothetical protein
MAEFINVELKGTAKDAHQNFPIRFDYSEKNNSAFLIGCKVEAEVEIGGGKTITKRMDIRAFGEVAEALAHIADGTPIHVKGSYDMQKSTKGDQWFPVVTVLEVIEA